MLFNEQYSVYLGMIELALASAVPEPKADWLPDDRPGLIARAMRYSLLSGGKRLRPVLLLAAYQLLDESIDMAIPFAVALEMIHCYSLIHDDLPAMDNDDLRRGKPSNHKVFGETIAILAGDALLNAAYEVMSGSKHPRAMTALGQIAARAGSKGMIAGQAADIFMEGKTGEVNMLAYIHRHKTGDLIVAPLVAGLTLAGAGTRELQAGEAFGQHLGLAFQIVDDLLDLGGDPQVLGKKTGKDASIGKLTWPSIFGQDQAKRDAHSNVDKAVEALSTFGPRGAFLCSLALSTLDRVQ
jgi:geranylgeranyl diphosphate synthase, type II